MRTPAVDGDLAPALTAYATDLTLIGTALRPLEGFSQRGNGTVFTSAVTSHTIWFHRPFRTDDWLLLRQHSPVLAHGRCFGRGDVLAEDGSLVASYAQEALLRFREAADHLDC
jgi:acyl-CoA thioesterase II